MSFFDDFPCSAAAERTLLLQKNDIELYKFSHYRYLCSGERIVQGAMDTLAPAQVQSPVVIAMLAGLQLNPSAQLVLNLGMGCAAIERYLDAEQPTMSVVTVDSSEDVIELCQQADLLPKACTPIVADAAQFLTQTTERFDAVLCDLAIGAQQPDLLRSEFFYSACRQRMSEGAVLIVNVLCANNETVSKVCIAARRVFEWTAVVDVPGFDNVVLYASGDTPAIAIGECEDTNAEKSNSVLSRLRILP